MTNKGKEKESLLLETKKRKALELAPGSSLKKVDRTTRATAAATVYADESVENDSIVFYALLEHLSLPLIYLNEMVTPLNWSQICEHMGLKAMQLALSANILVNSSHFSLFLYLFCMV